LASEIVALPEVLEVVVLNVFFFGVFVHKPLIRKILNAKSACRFVEYNRVPGLGAANVVCIRGREKDFTLGQFGILKNASSVWNKL
jgi:hypothetical protein